MEVTLALSWFVFIVATAVAVATKGQARLAAGTIAVYAAAKFILYVIAIVYQLIQLL